MSRTSDKIKVVRGTSDERRRMIAWAALAILGLCFVIADRYSPRNSPSEPIELTNSLLLIRSRDRLAICVKPVEGAVVDLDRARQLIGDTLREMSLQPRWSRAGFDRNDPVVETGCPEKPSVLAPTTTITTGPVLSSRTYDQPRVTSSPSRYVLIVYVLPSSLIDRFFFGYTEPQYAKYRKEVEEEYCEGHVCSEITKGLYLRPSEVTDYDTVRSAVEYTFGFNPPDPPATVDPSDRAQPKPALPPR